MTFAGKVAVVTGGASGIGQALCLGLGGRGARVVVADVNLAGAEETAQRIERAGGNAEAKAVDVTDRAAVEALIAAVCGEHGRLDLMFNNAGIAIVGPAAEFSPEQWERLVDVNIRGVIHGTHAAYRRMLEQGDGHIVNTASIAGLLPSPTFTAYATTKHAVVGLSTSLRVEAARHGVRVSVICPGVIDTPMVDNAERIGSARQMNRGMLGFKPYDVSDCARDVLAGVERNDPVIVVTRMAQTMHAIFRHAPRIGWSLIEKGYRRMQARLR